MKTQWINALMFCAASLAPPLVPAQGQELPADVNAATLTRLPQLTRDDLDAEGQAVYDSIVGTRPAPGPGPVGVSLYSPKIADVWNELNNYLRNDSVIGRGFFELAVLVAAYEIEQQFEYTGHEPAALEFGISRAAVDAVKDNRPITGLPAKESIVIDVGRQLLRDHALDAATFDQAVELFGRQGVVELITTMGDYVMVGMVLTAINQQLPADREKLLPER